MKVTQWFSEHVKPEMVGVYETRFDGNIGFSYWDGKLWTNQARLAEIFRRATFREWTTYAVQNKKWRGLADKP